jgi:hypothetical protein
VSGQSRDYLVNTIKEYRGEDRDNRLSGEDRDNCLSGERRNPFLSKKNLPRLITGTNSTV